RFEPVLALKRMRYEERLARLVDALNGDRRAAQRRADSLETMAEQVLVELLAGDNAYRPDDWFPRVSCRSLVILGNTDKGAVVRGEDRPRLTSLLRDTRLVEWEDVGHGIHAEQPQRFVAEVRAFLDSLGTGTALS
ncbi:MAG: alpha/beta hydrolase, partial [Nitrospinae bacterium]|nr:alpha/beta hydrolase [Nitrospinota bacterium]